MGLTSIKKVMKKWYLFRPLVWVNEIVKFEKSLRTRRKAINSDLSIQAQRCEPWFKINGDETLRLDYELNENSIVFDVGGYKGEFASAILNKYNCHVYIFEPIPTFFEIIAKKFSNNCKVHPYCFGLSDITTTQKISLLENSSSLFIDNSNTLEIRIISAIDFINQCNLPFIDLFKVNIEGAEYPLLEGLIESNLVTKIKNIQVQFHDFIIPNASHRMHQIQEKLSKTHQLTYQYEFVWENWRLRTNTNKSD